MNVQRCRRSLRGLALAAAAAGTLAGAGLGVEQAGAVVGGSETVWDDHPHFVQLLMSKPDLSITTCGASVIDTDMILTAAHCVDDVWNMPDRISVSTFTSITVAQNVSVHPLWNGDPSDGHDLAVIRLPGGTTPGITPVTVGAPGDQGAYAAGTEVFFAGHGWTGAGGARTPELRELHTVLRSDDAMDDVYNPWYWYDSWNSSLMIGAGFTNHTICHGDSGGPLITHRNGVTVQVGLASFVQTWPDECAQPGGFAELNNAQLAWVALYAPGIKARWGTCVDAGGLTRTWDSTYSAAGVVRGSAHQSDGPNYMWSLTCGPAPVNAPPPRTTPPPPPPPRGPTCRVVRCQEQ